MADKSSSSRWGTQSKPGWPGRPGLPRGRAVTGRTAFPFFVALLLSVPAVGEASAQRSTAGAWGIEAVGGTVGSVVGFGVGALFTDDDCGENLDCILDQVSKVLVGASAGATLGTVLAGRLADTNPSTVGAAVGSLAGAAAGLGALKLIDELDDDSEVSPAVVAISFSVSQGMITALGSRIGAALR